MKTRDRILFGFPVAVTAVVVFFAWLLYWQHTVFMESFLSDAENSISHETMLAREAVSPFLQSGDESGAKEFCEKFRGTGLRLSVIAPDGRVIGDSDEDPEEMVNHSARPEVSAAMSGAPATDRRFSESVGEWMIYHSVPLETPDGVYVVRSSVKTDATSRILTLSKVNLVLAVVFGGMVVAAVAAYVLRRVRKPLLLLQSSVMSVASGILDVRIRIPRSGVLRDLAIGVSEMTEKLKKTIESVSRERNDKEAILSDMTDAVLLTLSDGSVAEHNRSAERLFQIAPGGSFNVFRSGVKGLADSVEKAFSVGAGFKKEFSMTFPDSTEGVIFVSATFTGGGLLLTITDLTELRRLESFRSDFLAHVTHEIRTPLTCISGAAEVIREEPDLPKEKRMEMAEMIFTQAARMNSLVNDILNLLSIERKTHVAEKDFFPVNLFSVAVNAAAQTSPAAHRAGISISVSGNRNAVVDGDAPALEQAIVNLIVNAIRYSGSKKIDVSVDKCDGKCRLSVRDYGCGIPREHRERIFERFYRVHKDRSRALGGTGLGLSIVKHTAQLHGGSAVLECPEDGGCIFSMMLPESVSSAEDDSGNSQMDDNTIRGGRLPRAHEDVCGR